VTKTPDQQNQPDDDRDAASRWKSLPTEARHPASADLDRMRTDDIVTLLLEEDARGIENTLGRRHEIARAAELVAETLESGGSVTFAGAGTSGRLGVLEAAECPPTFGTDPEMIRAVIAGGEEAVFRAAEGAEDREDDGRASVRNLGEGDLLIALSASSVTPYARGALSQARQLGAGTILLTCATSTGLEDLADLVVALATGPEILTGSTRLKAGSATKAALNAITTAAMVRLGKTFGNLMIDLRPGSAKLRDRAVRILEAACDLPTARARDLYSAAGGELKTAIVMERLGLSAEDARERLVATRGHVREAIEAPTPGS
jgi:N-acetylmuramic acid 6-phosphate etherase